MGRTKSGLLNAQLQFIEKKPEATHIFYQIKFNRMAQIKLNDEKIIFEGHGTLKQLHFDLQKKDGEWETQTREVFDHGNAATILLYNRENKTVVLTKQFRIASYVNGNNNGMLVETCAGLLEEGEDPNETIIREVEEETGYVIKEVKKVFEAYTSPGAFTELVHYYIAPYTKEQKQAAGGGLEEEGEEVKVLELSFEAALQMVKRGEIKDAKTILLLYHLQLEQLI
jgi:GDP-mannose pyrophosphatase NudK